MKKLWLKSLHVVLKEHNGSVSNKTKRASDSTIRKREIYLSKMFTVLGTEGFELEDVKNLKRKHVDVLCSKWERDGLAPATIQLYLSILRVFCGWIGKGGMVQASAKMVSTPDRARRSPAAQTDKSWETSGVTAEELIQRMREINPRMAVIMKLARVFGLRLQEAYMIKPHQADKDKYLMVNWGTKGGKRRRSVPINSQNQKDAIEEAKQFAGTELSSMIPDEVAYKTYRNRTRWHLDKIGMTQKKLGVTFHGARHAYLNDRFEEISGVQSPARSMTPVKAQGDNIELARQVVAEDAGHGRKSISSAYLGAFSRGSSKQ